MARRPLKTKEQIAAVPLDQSVELDMTPDDPVVEIINDMTPPANGAAVEAPAPKREPVREPEDDKLALKKQADDLRAAEEARATEELRRQEMERLQQRNQELETQNRQSSASQINSSYNEILASIGRMESEAASAQSEYENAAATGDYKRMGEFQRKMSKCEANLVHLENGKVELEYQIDQWKRQAQQPQQPPEMTADQRFEAHIQQFPDLVKQWTRQHRDYMEPGLKNKKLQRAHIDADLAGIPLYSQDYIDFVEKQVGLRPNDEEEAPDLEPARRTPVSAPVSRESMSPSTGRPTTQKVTLSAEERQTAREIMPNTDPGEAERLYAMNKMKMLEAKKNGLYRD